MHLRDLSDDRLTLYGGLLILRPLLPDRQAAATRHSVMQNLDVRRAVRILVAQVITTMVVAVLATLFGFAAALYALIGGAIATLANALFAYWVFGRYRAQEPGRLVGQFYGGELIKLFFTGLAFAGVIIWLDPISPIALFGAFFAVQVLPPLLVNRIAR